MFYENKMMKTNVAKKLKTTNKYYFEIANANEIMHISEWKLKRSDFKTSVNQSKCINKII